MSFTMEEAHTGGATCLAVSGELDLASADAFAAKIRSLRGARSKVTLDLSGVNFMDSIGLTALVGAITEARRADQEIALAPHLSPQVARLVQITGVTTILNAS